MRNFQLIAANIDTTPLLFAIQRQPELWNQNTLRTTHPGTPHTQVDDIWIRFNEITEDVGRVMDEHESVWYPATYALPQVKPLIQALIARVDGERLGRVLITRVAPGKKIDPHVDGGSHAAYYDRFHLVLQSSPGTTFRAGEEIVYMPPGTIWWFDNSKEHEVINGGSEDRIHMIVDIRTQHGHVSG